MSFEARNLNGKRYLEQKEFDETSDKMVYNLFIFDGSFIVEHMREGHCLVKKVLGSYNESLLDYRSADIVDGDDD